MKMKVEDIKWESYSVESIDFILTESEKLVEETFKSFRETTNRCYYALGIYLGVFSFCVNKIFDNRSADNSNIPFILIIFGIFICLYTLYNAILPGQMRFPGTQPQKLLTKTFEDIPINDQLFEYKIQTIVSSNNSFLENMKQIQIRNDKLKTSIICFIITILIALFSFYLSI